MIIRVFSDIHSEFHADWGFSFIRSLIPRGEDLIILAGDIGNRNTIAAFLGVFCAHFPDSQVLYIPGNHEHYRATSRDLWGILRNLNLPNLIPPEPRMILEIGGLRIVACTLWFPETPLSNIYEGNMSDFSEIPKFRDWVYIENWEDRRFLRRALSIPTDLVITHYLPSTASIVPEFKGSVLNQYFLTDMSEEILDYKPRVWVHGHTHCSLDYTLGETRIVCNPFGYPSGINPSFSEEKVVELNMVAVA